MQISKSVKPQKVCKLPKDFVHLRTRILSDSIRTSEESTISRDLSGTNLLESLACPSNLTLVHTYEDKRDLVAGMRIYRGAGTDVVLRNYTYDALGRPLTCTTSRNGAMSPEPCR